ncbi:MAG: hypothetical protein HYT63_03445, partial [Candidatus Yanofskybacteria bacterium]|nr:hypothetical protein [Candidatus Yanofskybacteria bacterium]
PEPIFKEISGLYKNNIKFPNPKPAKIFLLCPVGTVGAGKTTVIKPLSEKLNLARVSTDEIRKILKERGFNYNRARELVFGVTKELVEEGYGVAIDANCGGDKTSEEKIRELQNKYGIDVVWVHVNPPESFIVNKLKHYKHDWLFKNGDEAVSAYFKYKEKYGNFENLNLPYVYTFDTSKPNIKEQVEEAVEIIKSLEK